MKARLVIGLLVVVLIGITFAVTQWVSLHDVNTNANTSHINGRPAITQAELKAKLIDGLKSGDAAVFAPYFGQEVTLTILDDMNSYTPQEARRRIETFFQNYPPQSFQERHEGSSATGASQYLIGNLRTSSRTFRVYVLFQNNRIQEMEFSPESGVGK